MRNVRRYYYTGRTYADRTHTIGIIGDKIAYKAWKDGFRKMWEDAWLPKGKTDVLPIWCDHENDTWIDMRDGQQMNPRRYGDDL